MNDYNSKDKEPEYKSLRNRLEDKLYSERGSALAGTLSVLAGTGFLVAGILTDNKTVTTLYSIAAGVSYLNAGLHYGFSMKNKE